MSSESDNEGTPPEIVQEAANSLAELVPRKSKERYETCYGKFMEWRASKSIKSFSENVLLAYFGKLSENYKPSSLWSIFSMLRSLLNLKHNIDVSRYNKLRAFLKRKSTGFQSKKSCTLTPREISTFLTTAPDKVFLLEKVICNNVQASHPYCPSVSIPDAVYRPFQRLAKGWRAIFACLSVKKETCCERATGCYVSSLDFSQESHVPAFPQLSQQQGL